MFCGTLCKLNNDPFTKRSVLKTKQDDRFSQSENDLSLNINRYFSAIKYVIVLPSLVG